MKYPVIKKFRDKYTKIRYKIGDIYETEDIKRAEYLQSKEAIGEQTDKPEDELAGKIESGVEPTDKCNCIELPKHIGGGWYELPDGTRIKGRESAEKALNNAFNNIENTPNGGEKT